MWAACLTAPERFDFIEMGPPSATQLNDGEVVLRMLAGGICGSDTPKFKGIKGGGNDGRDHFRAGPPGFPLHEIVGEVVASRAGDLRIGERVVGWAQDSDGLAEYVVTRSSSVTRYDPALDPVEAVLIQPLACVLEALDRLPVRGRRVVVLGLGPIGLLFAHVARTRGAHVVVGVDPVDRSGHPSSQWPDRIVVATSEWWAANLERSARPELLVEAVGHQTDTLEDGINACERGATILYFGIPDQDVYPLNMEQLMRKNLTLVGGVTRDRRKALRRANSYFRAHPELGCLITHDFDRKDATAAFKIATQPSSDRLKVVIRLDGEAR